MQLVNIFTNKNDDFTIALNVIVYESGKRSYILAEENYKSNVSYSASGKSEDECWEKLQMLRLKHDANLYHFETDTDMEQK